MTRDSQSILLELLASAIESGADELEVEYKDGFEEVYAMRGGTGFSIAMLESRSEEASRLREELYAMRRKKKERLSLAGAEYDFRVIVYDSFGEDAFRVKIKRV